MYWKSLIVSELLSNVYKSCYQIVMQENFQNSVCREVIFYFSNFLFQSDPFTILKCLTVVSESLTQLPIKTLTPTLHMLLESQVWHNIINSSQNIHVRS